MVQHSKCCVDESQPRVRIPLSAPRANNTNPENSRFVFFFAIDYLGIIADLH